MTTVSWWSSAEPPASASPPLSLDQPLAVITAVGHPPCTLTYHARPRVDHVVRRRLVDTPGDFAFVSVSFWFRFVVMIVSRNISVAPCIRIPLLVHMLLSLCAQVPTRPWSLSIQSPLCSYKVTHQQQSFQTYSLIPLPSYLHCLTTHTVIFMITAISAFFVQCPRVL